LAKTITVGRIVYEEQENGVLIPIGELTLNGDRPNERRTRSAFDILGDPPTPSTAILEPSTIVRGGEAVLAAPTKVGKTSLWLHFGYAMTEGAELWRTFRAPEPVTVLLIELELSEPEVHKRLALLRDMLDWSDEGQKRFHVRCERAVTLNRVAGQKAVTEMVERVEPDVVILDSFNAAMRGDADKTGDAREALHALHSIQDATGITWGLTGELRKAPAGSGIKFSVDDLKGSNELAYDADTVILLQPRSDRRRLQVHFVGMRHDDTNVPEDLMLVRDGVTFEAIHDGGVIERAKERDKVRQAVREVLTAHIASGGKTTWRESVAAVRASGVEASNGLITEVRREVVPQGVIEP
jgi:AAA domain